MQKIKRKAAIALSLLLAFGAMSCATTQPTGSGGGDTASVLNVHIDVEPASMDPQIATDGTSFEIIACFTEGLYTVDANGAPMAAIAENVDISADGLTYTFKLRDAKWSNGEPVTASDFVFSWRRAVDPATASEYAYIIDTAGVKNAKEIAAGSAAPDTLGVSAPDPKTFKVELAFPVPYFLSLMTFPTFYPVNQAFFEASGANYASGPDYILSNGPFKMTQYQPMGSSIELVKNPDYYNASSIKIAGIKYQVIKDTQQTMLSYSNGDIDVATLSGEQSENFASDPEFTPVMAGYLWFISPNQKVAGLENVNLRLAIALSFDKDAIVKNILKDGSIVANFAVPTTFSAGPDGKDFRATAGAYLATDKAKAKDYYQTAKTELKKETFSYTMLVEDTESATNVAQFLKAEIESNLPGFTLNLEIMPKPTRVARMESKNYEIGLTRWGPDYADPMTYLDLWITGAQNNFGSWSNAEYDALIASCKSGELAIKPQERWEALKSAEKIAMDNAAIFPVYQKGNAEMIKQGVKGIEFHTVAINRIYRNVTITPNK